MGTLLAKIIFIAVVTTALCVFTQPVLVLLCIVSLCVAIWLVAE